MASAWAQHSRGVERHMDDRDDGAAATPIYVLHLDCRNS